MDNRTPREPADHRHREHAAHGRPDVDDKPRHQDHTDVARGEHAQEERGAAARHDHQAIAHAEHDRDGHRAEHGAHGVGHAGHGEEVFERPFWVALVLTLPVLIYAEHIRSLLGYAAPAFPGSRWLEPVLASVIYWYGGRVFLGGAVAVVRAGPPGLMTLVWVAMETAIA
jgi:Cu2+-exporting ATPase